jgi:hypothetical protein
MTTPDWPRDRGTTDGRTNQSTDDWLLPPSFPQLHTQYPTIHTHTHTRARARAGADGGGYQKGSAGGFLASLWPFGGGGGGGGRGGAQAAHLKVRKAPVKVEPKVFFSNGALRCVAWRGLGCSAWNRWIVGWMDRYNAADRYGVRERADLRFPVPCRIGPDRVNTWRLRLKQVDPAFPTQYAERTFLAWLNMSVTLASISVAILAYVSPFFFSSCPSPPLAATTPPSPPAGPGHIRTRVRIRLSVPDRSIDRSTDQLFILENDTTHTHTHTHTVSRTTTSFRRCTASSSSPWPSPSSSTHSAPTSTGACVRACVLGALLLRFCALWRVWGFLARRIDRLID